MAKKTFFSRAPGNAWGVHRSMCPWAASEIATNQRKGISTNQYNHQTDMKVLDQEILLSFILMQDEVLEPPY